ncbi:gabA permease (Gamma-aminobutyrate permease) GabP domain protein [Mycobacterium ulcerans str. Harvey]|uniref:GabA permease (Gamma-aminobutyrate permease) GabP domain protein n=1 Tax=Mycobacterium ulcerans str. Harvey TaxID=1299332 RepID=A0ABN0R997_MYCUL|nr:gabA permease (Gamma-aminobutyrate permease) GabP domain protein [Mycobacterium ulcerans str. Harvey]
MIMAWIAPTTVFIFLLNSSGAVLLFVYLLIAFSQIVLRGRTPPEKLRVRMWFSPGCRFSRWSASSLCWSAWLSTTPRTASSGSACCPGLPCSGSTDNQADQPQQPDAARGQTSDV